ncbi:Sodium/hydrogen exchanger 3 [Phytophthora palmivora]|uniref:Sodium/hydrogen exchanger 3 n=1 Tax=Phytophthora palmivora TaxID=4796 RepID=A0A2P4WW98_9STRA|nr:Sodium/hydrogen exchanger 3 [Phytophthora palmivora]
MFTTLVFGMGTSPVLRYFGLTATQEQAREFDDEGAHERLLSEDDEHDADTSFRPIDRSTPRRHISGIHGVWERIDEKYLKPLFGGLPRDEQHSSEPSPAELKRPTLDPSNTSPRNRRNSKQKQSPKLSSPKSQSSPMPHMSLAEIAENHDASDNVSKMETVSEEMMSLYEAQRRAHDTVLTLQAQIEEEEAIYLEETPHGNIIRGWEGFIDSKQPRKDANPKKMKPYSESEYLFSNCCFYASMASEPSFDQVDIYDTTKDESTSRRKLTVTLSVGKGSSSSISGVVDSSATHSTYRGGNGSKLQSAQKTTTAAATYQASKLKKRKREEAVTTAKAHETVSTGPQSVIPTTGAAPPASDFLDVL